MIEFTRGDLLAADADALVNAVNTVGVMGKGLALQFKRAYPAMFEDYRRACRAGEVRLGGLDWADVCPRIVAALSGLADTRVLVFEPA